MEKNENINVITLGPSGVGKTSIIKRIKDGTFEDTYKTTIALDHFFIKSKYEKKHIIITLHFRDTNGLESMQSLIPIQYLRDSHIVLLIFSDLDTLDDIINRWYSFYQENTNIDNSRFILVGNKSDLFGNKRDEIINQGNQFAEEIDALFLTCSAKSADNMDNLERYILTESKRFIDDEEKKKKNIDKKIKLDNKKNNKNNIDKNNNGNSKCC